MHRSPRFAVAGTLALTAIAACVAFDDSRESRFGTVVVGTLQPYPAPEAPRYRDTEQYEDVDPGPVLRVAEPQMSQR